MKIYSSYFDSIILKELFLIGLLFINLRLFVNFMQLIFRISSLINYASGQITLKSFTNKALYQMGLKTLSETITIKIVI